MELKAGYKLTEVGVIPEDWEVLLVDDVSVRGSGHTPSKKYNEYWNGSIQWISLADSNKLDRLYISETSFCITEKGLANSSAVLHRAGTVVLSRDAGVGKSSIMKFDMAVSQHFIAWKCLSKLNNIIFYYWLQFNKKSFEKIANGNTIKTIGLDYFESLKIGLPTQKEQKNISKLLTDTDLFIDYLGQLIAKKRDIKQATMQQLLTGQTRLPGFSGEWMKIPLGNVLKICHGKNQKQIESVNGAYPILATGGQIGLASEFIYNKSSVLIGRKGTIDKPKYMDTPFWCVDTLYYTKIMDGFYPKFIYYKFLMIPWSTYNEASGVPSLNSKTIEKIEIDIPCLEEQQAIAQVLSDMDAEIEKLEAQKAKAQAIKQGMMQELLTGKTRLVEPGELVDGDAAS